MELNGSGDIVKTYVYANSEVIAQHDGDNEDEIYFYLHDRLGSVRLVINDSGNVVSHYTYEPFGEVIDDDVTFVNDFLFTGQYFDFEIEEYYLRARQYNPAIARFTSRDPVRGKFTEPFTLHKYLYCLNDPVNNTDATGKFAGILASLNTRAANAIAVTGAAQRLTASVRLAVTLANATFSGFFNMMTGPSSASDSELFAIGFAAGAIEMQAVFRGAGSTAGSAFAGALTAAMNQVVSDNSFVSFQTALKVGISAGFGALEGYGGSLIPWDDAEKKITFFLAARLRDVYTHVGEVLGEAFD